MKTLPKLLILLAVLIIACSDDESPNFQAQLLQQYEWHFTSTEADGRIVAVTGQPFPYLNTGSSFLIFTGDKSGTYSQTMGVTVRQLGKWKVEGGKLVLNDSRLKLKTLSREVLVYETPDNKYTVTWRAVAK